MIETSFLPSPMVEFDANFLEVQIKIANKLVCSLLCLRQKCIFVFCSFQNILNFFHLKFPSRFSETWNLTKKFSRRETWLKVTFLFIPWAIGTWRLSDDSCRRTFQQQNHCRRMIANFNENIIEEFFGQFISNPARQKKTNST